MKIGYSVEGSTDRAFLTGLKDRLCPGAKMIAGTFRGRTGLSLRREFPKICEELALKGAETFVFPTDSNEEPWRVVQKNERAKFPQEHLDKSIHGVAERNIECWLCADPNWLAKRLGADASLLTVEDPKREFERSMGITTRDNRKETEIARLVCDAPFRIWIDKSRSFEDFWAQIWAMSKRLSCSMENLRDSGSN